MVYTVQKNKQRLRTFVSTLDQLKILNR